MARPLESDFSKIRPTTRTAESFENNGFLTRFSRYCHDHVESVLGSMLLLSGLAIGANSLSGCGNNKEKTDEIGSTMSDEEENDGGISSETTTDESSEQISEHTLTGSYCVYFYSANSENPGQPDALASLSLVQDGSSLNGNMSILYPEVVYPEEPIQSGYVTDQETLSFWAALYNESTGDATSFTSEETNPDIVEGNFGRIWTINYGDLGNLTIWDEGSFKFGTLPCPEQ